MTTTATTIERPTICGKDTTGPAIYVACLASYNSGHLHGAWLNLGDVPRLNASDIQDGIDYVLKTSPVPNAEEYAVHDYQGIPAILRNAGFLASNEHPDLEALAEWVTTWQECEGNGNEGDTYREYCDHIGQAVTAEEFNDAYQGTFESEAEFAEDFYEQTGQMPTDSLVSYIDWDRVWYGVFSCDGWFSIYLGAGEYAIFSPV